VAEINIFTGSSGLNIKIDPARLPYDPETGVQDLAVAVNVDHDYTGRVSRRKGFAATARTEVIHSLWCDGGPCLFVTGDALCLLNPDYTYKLLRNVTENAKMRYVQVDDIAYYTNGIEMGYVQNGASAGWSAAAAPYGPDPTTRTLYSPPVGSHLEVYNGHMFIAQGNIVWFSEPFAYNHFDLVRSYLPFGGEVRMFKSVEGGIWISTHHHTYFLEGSLPKEFRRRIAATYPAIEDTVVQVDASKLGNGEFQGLGLLWTTREGICLGLSDGTFMNLTQRKIDLPHTLRGAGLLFDERYVALLEP
jgi:hypothetical protein